MIAPAAIIARPVIPRTRYTVVTGGRLPVDGSPSASGPSPVLLHRGLRTSLDCSWSPASTSVRWGRVTAPDSRIVILTGRGDAGTSSLAAGVTAAPLARALGAPLLVTAHRKLAKSVAANIVDRGATEVIIVGRKRVVSADVAEAVAALGVRVTRMGGGSDASVAHKVAARMGDTGSAVLVSPGGSPAHSLAGSALAARRGVPVLIATEDTIPNKTLEALSGRTSLTVVATPAAISSTTVRRAVGGLTWNRLVGADPTSAISASIAVASAFPGSDTSAAVLPKAPLWGWRTAPVAASAGAPLLFTKKKTLVPEVVAFLRVRSRLDVTLSSAQSQWLSDEVLGDAHRVLRGESVSGDTTTATIPPQPTTQYSATRTNAKPEPVRAGDPLTLTTTVQSQFTDGSWRPIPAGQAFVIQFKKAGTTSYRVVGTGYTRDGIAQATVTPTQSGKWRILIGETKTRRDYVEVIP